jgi:hypothetical protein
VVATLLEHDDLRAGFRKARGHHGAARAASHDADVGAEQQVLADLVAADDSAHGRPLEAFTVRTRSYGGPGYPTEA